MSTLFAVKNNTDNPWNPKNTCQVLNVVPISTPQGFICPNMTILWGYPSPTNSKIIICWFWWRAPHKPSFSTVSGLGIPPNHTDFWSSPFHHQWFRFQGQDGWWIYKYYRNSIGLHTEWPQRQALLKQQIQQVDPEILCLQETWQWWKTFEGRVYKIIQLLVFNSFHA